ncbi:MAG: transcription termination/antitermination protein NusA [Candidatus Dormibacteraeota bacterium]|nr:transcription termination/antitermination protein NusA [Candidatus Dormibacteraeota bacterium]
MRTRTAAAPPAENRTAAIEQLAADTSLSPERIARVVEDAVAATYRRLVEDDPEVRARVDPEHGRWQVYRELPDGGEVVLQVGIPDFERQAAAAVRNAVAGEVAEVARRKVLDVGSSRHGELVDAILERPDGAGPAWYVDAAGVPGYLPADEQIPGERLERRRHIKVVVLEGRRRMRDAVLVVSRTHPLLLQRLLEQEVPELQSGQVVVRGIAREPGRRSKVAVEAPDGDLDPQGACIGPRGVRQRAVTSELGEEQVQIVAWSADPATFVGNALIPATVLGVELDDVAHTAHIEVPGDQLSLAIGRSGENARLAFKLTGWRIDIRGGPAPG